MAVIDQSTKIIELLSPGMEVVSHLKSCGWIQNLRKRGDWWETRPGFGQIGQFDTSFSYLENTNAGVMKHLGSKHFTTAFGHEQIISCFRAYIYTGSVDLLGNWQDVYLVFIYDLTTKTYIEEWLYPHTSDTPLINAITLNTEVAFNYHAAGRRRGIYESCWNHDHRANNIAPNNDGFFFTEVADTIVFGNSRTGVLVYQPCIFKENRNKQLSSVYERTTRPWYSESSVLRSLPIKDGTFTDRYQYFTEPEIPGVICAIGVGNRLVYAASKSIYFSDPGRIGSICTDNYVTIPSDKNIKAIQSLGDLILIHTESETFAYSPSDGYIMSEGRLTKVSDTIGCLGPTATCKTDDGVCWVDRNGVYFTANGLNIQDISEGSIKPFFDTFITNPLTSYYTRNGLTALSAPQPTTTYQFDSELVNLSWDYKYKVLLFTLPNLKLTFCFSGGWYIWNYESVVSTSAGSPVVQAQQNIPSPWLVTSKTSTYCITSVETNTFMDDAVGGHGIPIEDNFVTRSFSILELGVGGGLDRNVQDEDNRNLSGKWKVANYETALSPSFYFGPLIPICPYGVAKTIAPEDADNSGDPLLATHTTFALPIYLQPGYWNILPPFAGLERFDITFSYDSTNWTVCTVTGSPSVQFLLPGERAHDWQPYQYAPPALTGVAATVDGAGVPTVGTNIIRLNYVHAQTGITTPMSAVVAGDILGDNITPVIYLLFNYRSAVGGDTNSMGIIHVASQIYEFQLQPVDTNLFVWCESIAPFFMNYLDKTAQAVDWAIKSDQIGKEEKSSGILRLKARGLVARMTSRGKARTPIKSGWVQGLYNTLVGADGRDWSSQVTDYTGDYQDLTVVEDQGTIQARIRPLLIAENKTFNNVATWSSLATPTHGNYLIDDEQVDSITTSDSVKGEHFSYMAFGHVREKAEKLLVSSLKAIVRVVGNAYRRFSR